MTLQEAEMEGHWHCCPNVALMCPCCPIVNFKHSAHCSANSVCRHDLSTQRKHNLLYIISPWRKYSHISLWKEKNQHLSFHFSKCKLLLPLCLLRTWHRRLWSDNFWGRGTLKIEKSKRLCARCVSIVDSGICPWPLRFAEWFFRGKTEVFQIWISTPTYNSFHYHNLHPNLPRRQTVASNYSKLTDVQTCFRWIPAQIA